MAVGIHSPAGKGITSPGCVSWTQPHNGARLWTREVYGRRPTCPDQLGRETAVRPTLLLMVGGTHRQESPGHWSDFPGNAWPAPLPQFIYKQKTGSLDQLLPQRPEPALARCLLPPNKIPTALLAETSRERLHSTVPSSRVPRAPAAARASEKPWMCMRSQGVGLV